MFHKIISKQTKVLYVDQVKLHDEISLDIAKTATAHTMNHKGLKYCVKRETMRAEMFTCT